MKNVKTNERDLLNNFLTEAPMETLKEFSAMLKEIAVTEPLKEFAYHVGKYLVSRMIWDKLPMERRTSLEDVGDNLENIVEVVLKEGGHE